MIDYLTVCYKNYGLITLQVENFNKRFKREDYRLIVVDNTPDHLKNHKFNDDLRKSGLVDVLIEIPSQEGVFDGVSHGSAIDAGLTHCNSDIICVFDSDFFFTYNNVTEYIIDKFKNGYKAVGTGFGCGPDYRKHMDKHPETFENMPVLTGTFYSSEIPKSNTYVVTYEQVEKVRNDPKDTFFDTGWRVRKYMWENNIKRMAWEPTDRGINIPSYYTNENGKTMGFHIWEGTGKSMDYIKEILNKFE